MFLKSQHEFRQTNSSATQSHINNKVLPNIFQSKEELIKQYYCNHFLLLEEEFYGHIGDIILLLKQNVLKGLYDIYHNNCYLNYFDNISRVNYSNFGCCVVAKTKSTNRKVILKHISKFNSTKKIKHFIDNFKSLKTLGQSSHFENLMSYMLIENEKCHSLWYIYEYCQSISLDAVTSLMHKFCLGYNVDNESDFVHLLYSCDSVLDQSKIKFPEFGVLTKYFGCQLLCGISELHSNNIIHRHLNPTNIRITPQGILKITDFGIAKKYRWMYYDALSCTENGLALDYLKIKNPIKRIKLGGSFYYLEPHIRSNFTEYKKCRFDNYQMDDAGYHMDYFSCAMILFEMLFGFTFGDINLYQKYSFYKQFCHCDLLFFFSDFFIKTIKKPEEIGLALKDFECLQLSKLKKYVINTENGFIDFIINGLSSDISRWSSFITLSGKGQSIDFDALKQQYKCFRKVDFFNLVNTPKGFFVLLKEIDYKLKLDDSLNKLVKNNKPNDLDCDSNSSISDWLSDTNSFYIPEMPLDKFGNGFKTLNSNNQNDRKHQLDDLFQLNSKKLINWNTNKNSYDTNLINNMKQKLSEADNKGENLQNKNKLKSEYPSIFFNELIRDLEIKDKEFCQERLDNEKNKLLKYKLQVDGDRRDNKVDYLDNTIISKEEMERLNFNKYKLKNQDNILSNNLISKEYNYRSSKTKKNNINNLETSFRNLFQLDSETTKTNYFESFTAASHLPQQTFSQFNEDRYVDRYNSLDISNNDNSLASSLPSNNKSIYNSSFDRETNLSNNFRSFKRRKVDENDSNDNHRSSRFFIKHKKLSNKRIDKNSYIQTNNDNNVCQYRKPLLLENMAVKMSDTKVNNVNHIKQFSNSVLLDNKAMEIFGCSNEVKRNYFDRRRNMDLAKTMSVTRCPKLTFVRPATFSSPCVIKQATNTSQTDALIKAQQSNIQIQCNLDEKILKDAEIQTFDKSRIKNSKEFIIEFKEYFEENLKFNFNDLMMLLENCLLVKVPKNQMIMNPKCAFQLESYFVAEIEFWEYNEILESKICFNPCHSQNANGTVVKMNNGNKNKIQFDLVQPICCSFQPFSKYINNKLLVNQVDPILTLQPNIAIEHRRKKSVSFKIAPISSIFESEVFKQNFISDEYSSEISNSSIERINESSNNPSLDSMEVDNDEYLSAEKERNEKVDEKERPGSHMRFYFRPKVHPEDLEIIDDWFDLNNSCCKYNGEDEDAFIIPNTSNLANLINTSSIFQNIHSNDNYIDYNFDAKDNNNDAIDAEDEYKDTVGENNGN